MITILPLLLINLAMGVLEVYFPILEGHITDTLYKHDEAGFLKYSAIFLILLVAYPLIYIFADFLGYFIKMWIVRDEIYDNLNFIYHKDIRTLENAGYVASRIYDDIDTGLEGLIVSTMGLFYIIGVIVNGMITALKIHLSLAIAFIISAAMINILMVRMHGSLRKLAENVGESEAFIKGVILDFIKSYQIIRNLLGFPGIVRDYLTDYINETFSGILTLKSRSFAISHIGNTLNYAIMFVFICLVSFEVLSNKITLGEFITFIGAIGLVSRYIGTSLSLLPEMVSSWRYIERFYEFVGLRETDYYTLGPNIYVENLKVSYGDKTILTDITVLINKGERVLIKGRNGTGKTTFANVISGILSPESGKVILPKTISSITQPFEFPNVKVGEIVDEGTLREFNIEELKSNAAGTLSAGQKQKLAIALALSKDADVYIFDEPLANISSDEREFFKNKILSKTQGKTLIVISHGEYFDDEGFRILKFKGSL
ncbi:MAG: ABC transporter ATP-binding protein [Thermotogae bacterium]|nr:ABC transporter ATP-binding protein [Thermotogota bacterium]